MSAKGPKVGERAPDFELEGTMEEAFRLSEELKKHPVVLYFYASDFGPLCTLVMREFARLYPEIRMMGYGFFAISMDSVRVHRAWMERLPLPFPLLSDPKARVSALYGALMEGDNFWEGTTNRAVYIIDREGIVRYRWVAKHAGYEPHYEEIMEALRGISPG